MGSCSCWHGTGIGHVPSRHRPDAGALVGLPFTADPQSYWYGGRSFYRLVDCSSGENREHQESWLVISEKKSPMGFWSVVVIDVAILVAIVVYAAHTLGFIENFPNSVTISLPRLF